MRKGIPLSLTVLVIVLDQATKAWIVSSIPEGTVAYRFFDDFLWICHVRNDAVAFSFGADLPVPVKYIVFVLLPIAVIALIAYAIVSRKAEGETTRVQKWCLAGIVGGGVGNLVDRLFRSLRVVDWISVRMYGLLGMEYFPTWNIADAAVVCSVVLLAFSLLSARGGRGR